ncbi:MAG TPA: iron ABC transporter permease [Gemmatimonadales bacterium]|nr:iron ABC transporter permease [Gemmatimonadales bacterium]
MTSAARRRPGTLAIVSMAVAACVAGISLGAVAIPLDVIPAALLGRDPAWSAIVRDLRAPRVLLGFGVGGALAVAGTSLQAVIRNPLAEPWLLGLSGGAALGAILAITLGVPDGWSIALAAALGALLALTLVYRTATLVGRRLDPRALLLAGVVIGAFASALGTAVLAVADPFTFRAASMWLFGSFSGASWPAVGRFLIVALPAVLVLWGAARSLDLLALGEESAAVLGADVPGTRRVVVLATAVLTAATVTVAGVIGFVGLVVPHAVRGLVGPLHRRLLPLVFLAGGGFTVLADTLARTVLAPAELPVGVVTALVGVPIFATLLRRSLA